MMYHFVKNKEDLERVRDEFDEVISHQVKANPKMRDMSKKDLC